MSSPAAADGSSAKMLATDTLSEASEATGAQPEAPSSTRSDHAHVSPTVQPESDTIRIQPESDPIRIQYHDDDQQRHGDAAARHSRNRSRTELADELNELVAEHSEAIYRVARSVVRDSALAEDVVQETLIKVWRHLDSWRGEGSLKSWVLRIAHNTAVSTLRRIRDESRDPATLPEPAERHELEGDVQGQALVGQLWNELQRFDELTRSIVVMREIEDMTYDEIAEALRVPLPTVKTRLFRARRALSVALEAWR